MDSILCLVLFATVTLGHTYCCQSTEEIHIKYYEYENESENNAAIKVPSKDCRKKIDMVFIINTSHRLKIQKALNFVERVVSNFRISSHGVRVGMVLYSTYPHTPFDLNDYLNLRDLQAAISRVSYYEGSSNTPAALRLAYTLLTSRKHGSRTCSSVSKKAVLLTDEKSTGNGLQDIIEMYLEADIKIVSIGIGKKVDYNETKMMAGYPRSQHFFMIENYSIFNGFVKQFSKIICDSIVEPCQQGKEFEE